jgi:hypothetical protein
VLHHPALDLLNDPRVEGFPALSQFFTTTFDGVLGTDFCAAYNAVSTTGY